MTVVAIRVGKGAVQGIIMPSRALKNKKWRRNRQKRKEQLDLHLAIIIPQILNTRASLSAQGRRSSVLMTAFLLSIVRSLSRQSQGKSLFRWSFKRKSTRLLRKQESSSKVVSACSQRLNLNKKSIIKNRTVRVQWFKVGVTSIYQQEVIRHQVKNSNTLLVLAL